MQPEPVRNQLLASLPHDATVSLLPKLTKVTLEVREQLYEHESSIQSVYFVESGLISLMANFVDGMDIEVGMVGRAGMLGASVVLLNETAFFGATVQISGAAFRMSVGDFKNEIEVNKPLKSLLVRYSEVMRLQAMQTGACNGHHGLEQRLARCLLMAHDQINSSEIPLKHEVLAMMLGVHRPSVTLAVHRLQRSGLIKQSTGRVIVLDRIGLEGAACECYGLTQRRSKILLESTKKSKPA